MTFGISFVTLVNYDARYIALAYRLPEIVSVILTFALIFLIPVTVFRSKIVKPIPKSWSFFKRILPLLEGPLVVVNLFTF